MSLAIFLIALLPAAVVVIVAEKTRSKGAVVVAALVAALLGFLTGNAAYIGIDLLFVGIATYIAWNITNTPIYRTPEEIAAAQEKARLERIKEQEAAARRDKEIAELVQVVVVIVVVVVGGFLFWQFQQRSPSQHDVHTNAGVSAPAQQALTQPTRTAVTAQKAKQANSSQPSKDSQRNTKKAPAAERRSVEKCLSITNEQAMVRCLERAP